MRLEVGQAYPAPIGAEGGHYSYHGQHGLLLAFGGLTPRETEDVRCGQADFALFGYQEILFFLYRFGSVGWGDCPYSWHLDPVELPEAPAGGQHILLPVTLVELPGNIVRALRAISLSPEFSRVLVERIREQAAGAPMDRAAYNAAINAAYRGHTVDTMAARAFIRCRGGQ
jgi:hypothetical protein